MIHAHQPTIFPDSVIVAVSSKEDGSMKFGHGVPEQIIANRRAFLNKCAISPGEATLVPVTYETDDFARYREVKDSEKGLGMQPDAVIAPADALTVTSAHHALFLPLADCVGVVFYDTKHQVLMVSHIGRHSAEIDGAHKSVEYLQKKYASNPDDILVWLSPAVGKAAYPLHKKAGKGLHELTADQLLAAGVSRRNIEASEVDTFSHQEYYSHSSFLAGNQTDNGRFAVVAMMRAQGEPAS